MEEKRKPYVTVSFKQPQFSRAMVAIILLVAAAFGIQEIQRWQKRMLATRVRLHEVEGKLVETATRLHETETRLNATETELQTTEAKLHETEAELVAAKQQLQSYLPISPLDEPVAFIAYKWGISALTCIRMPQGYWTGWGSEDGIGRLLYYYTRQWDSVEAINQSGQYTLVGEDEWSDNWNADDGFENQGYYTHVAVQDLHPFTWSKSKDWHSNKESWVGRLTDYCRAILQP